MGAQALLGEAVSFLDLLSRASLKQLHYSLLVMGESNGLSDDLPNKLCSFTKLALPLHGAVTPLLWFDCSDDMSLVHTSCDSFGHYSLLKIKILIMNLVDL